MKLFSVSLIVCLFVVGAHAQEKFGDRYKDPPLYGELLTLYENQYKAVTQAIGGKPDDSWEGAYVYGDHHPDYLFISEKNGFLATATDHGFGTRFNYGQVRKEGNRIFLSPKIAKGTLNYEPVENVYRIVKWSGLKYLVPEIGLEKFAWLLHSKTHFNLEEYPRKGKLNEKSVGSPDLPEKYLRIIKRKPLKARITRILKESQDKRFTWNLGGMELEIDKGSEKGVVKGMCFFLYEDRKGIIYEVTAVSKNHSNLRALFANKDDQDFVENPKLRKGMSLRIEEPSRIVAKIAEVFDEKKSDDPQTTKIRINKGSTDGITKEMESFGYRNKLCLELSEMIISPRSTIATVSSVFEGACISDSIPGVKVGTKITTRPKGGNFTTYE